MATTLGNQLSVQRRDRRSTNAFAAALVSALLVTAVGAGVWVLNQQEVTVSVRENQTHATGRGLLEGLGSYAGLEQSRWANWTSRYYLQFTPRGGEAEWPGVDVPALGTSQPHGATQFADVR